MRPLTSQMSGRSPVWLYKMQFCALVLVLQAQCMHVCILCRCVVLVTEWKCVSTCYHVTGHFHIGLSLVVYVCCVYLARELYTSSTEVSAVCVMMVQGSVVEISIRCFRTMSYMRG